MPLRFAAAVLLVALVWGCTSAKDVYEDGMDLEVSGDYAAAANAYVLALERDRSLDNVPGRLAVAGREAVKRWVQSASALGPVEAADAYLAADALILRARGAGVDLARPTSFAVDRDATLDAAVYALLDEADAASRARDYAATLRALDRARAYRPSPDQQSALDAAARAAYAGWAEADYVSGRYRAAYGRAQSALALFPPDDPGAEPVFRLLDDIVADGTVIAAVFPSEPGDDLPRGLLREFDDALVDDELATLPPLVALVDPVEVRRQSRRTGRDARTPIGRPAGRDLIDNPRRTAGYARDLGADVGVAVELGPLLEERTLGETRDETARLRRGGGSATYQRRRVSLEMTADAAFVVVDADSRQVVCEGEVRERATDRYDVASYSGDWRDLDLSRSERALFADDADEVAADRLLNELRDQTAAALATKLARCLEQQVR